MTEAHRSGRHIGMPLDAFGEKGGLLVLGDALLPGPAAAIRYAIVGSI